MRKFLVYCDGGARGNPGQAAYGFVIKAVGISNFKFLISKQIQNPNIKIQNNIIYGSGYLGITTNNQAEYQGVLNALKRLRLKIKNLKLKIEDIQIECFLDSQLIVEQMNGRYKIKNAGLRPLYWQIRQLIMDLGGRVSFKYIPRSENEEADRLVNEAIDRHLANN